MMTTQHFSHPALNLQPIILTILLDPPTRKLYANKLNPRHVVNLKLQFSAILTFARFTPQIRADLGKTSRSSALAFAISG